MNFGLNPEPTGTAYHAMWGGVRVGGKITTRYTDGTTLTRTAGRQA